ncbi:MULTISPECIES: hypothetical protein [Ralstonia solanacearum species complex]|uniref:Lipoprotein n=3 Tax=Ralstonia solanacearum TaxID=305 RepID=A0ABF7RGY8_RALSL|nr:hypothetical protein [Ralstonia solanacearum]ALF86582.1 hypothetical protein RSUY_01830 [Ralstonia solanacearum]ATI26165.1 hypothetical protein CCY86_00910 [Ralstonia solanacearum]ATJ84948.1 hypothetical protein CDC59_00900 [Ralstonia solanacearum]EAP73490.1 Hypothetical Protein RRSL_03670 [Ralstonia solanacearum UW551]KEI33118.1 hypothetical protein CQ06_12520 [Ralstonia solanacearum]
MLNASVHLRRFVTAAAAVLCLACQSTAFAAPTITDLPIKLGDTVDEVKRALGTALDPEPIDQPNPMLPKKKQLRLKTKGIWVFFEKDRVTTYRVDAPFKGSIGGVHIGDDIVTLTKQLGNPVKTGSFLGRTTYTYYFDDITTTDFIISNKDEVETVFFIK